MPTLVAEDATLNNNLDLIEMPWVLGRNRRQVALGFGVEKIVANNLGLEVIVKFGRRTRGEVATWGTNNRRFRATR
jgi:hypothetical protein